MQDKDLKQATACIADWYERHKRALPWRQGKDPYRIWISEIMLQQTRIEAVFSYYERFLNELPDIEALASVPEDRLLKLWEGLGYYSRARNLKKAALILLSEYGGEMPRTAEQLRRLPGIGEYTAGAIASIAFGEPEPAVDGNVMRVMMRLDACSDDAMDAKVRKAVHRRLKSVYPTGERAAALTEGLMELGERICIPNGRPLCEACPAAALCKAHAKGEELRYPLRAKKKERRIEEKTVLLLRCGSRIALRKREEQGLLAGLWEFPSLDGHLTASQVEDYALQRGLQPRSVSFLGEAKHIFTHVEWRMTGYAVDCACDACGFVWVTQEEFRSEYSVPSAFRQFKAWI